jgi:5,10-methylenetetrahydromethanopterin reductase
VALVGHAPRMRIAINGSSLISLGRPAREMVDHVVQAERDGFDSYWMAQLGAPDALTVLAVMGQATSTIELGTAVISTWPRHPLMLAAQALTTSELCGGRLVLGIGLAHKPSVESTLKIPFERPARHMAQYLDVLLPALSERRVNAAGDIWSGEVESLGGPPDTPAPSVMLAAMGPRMLAMAGGRTDGSILWLSGPRVIETTIAPAVRAAAEEAGRPQPRIVASVPVCVTDQPEQVRALIAGVLAGYNDLPSYRGVMDAEGAGGPEDVSLIGDEAEVHAGLRAFAEAGATDFAAVEIAMDDETGARTRSLLKEAQAGARTS